jgi:hypothetical protein
MLLLVLKCVGTSYADFPMASVQYNNSFKAFKQPIAANLAAIQALLLQVPVRPCKTS